MSEKTINEIKPFRQVPSCDSDAMLSITGAEFEAIQNILSVFKAPLDALNSVFNRNLDVGTIVIKYVQEDGTEITKEQATEYIEQMKEIITNREEIPQN